MGNKGSSRNIKPLEMLTEEEIESIIQGTLKILEETGVRVEHKRALKLLGSNGCKVDYNRMMVRIPSKLVEECLKQCPSSFPIKARDPQNNIIMGDHTTYFKNSGGMKTIDLETLEPRIPTRKENRDAIRILNSLENLHILSAPYSVFEGVPLVMTILEGCADKIRNSTKVQMEGYREDSEIFQIQMAKAVGAEILEYINASPPLAWNEETMEALFRIVKSGFPINVIGGQSFGGTAPVTLAGALAIYDAELIVPIVLAQLIKPGTRVVCADYSFAMNMQSGFPDFGAIGSSLHLVAFNQVWRRYGIPTNSSTCGYSNSKNLDFQTGYEKAIQGILAGISGANLIVLHGAVSAELTFHPVQAVMDEDIAGIIGRFLRGFAVNDETLALDVISRVGPTPGHFLGEEHTRKWCRIEQFVPQSVDRLSYPEWMANGKRTALDYAREKMETVLAGPQPCALKSNHEEEIEKILEDARKYYKKQGKL